MDELQTFRVFFRRKKQFYDVFLHNTSPITFKRKGGGNWGYFIPRWLHPKKGLFGEIHLVSSRVRVDSVSHELDHLRCAWMFTNGVTLSTRNEEWYCKFGDELIRNFYREYRRIENDT